MITKKQIEVYFRNRDNLDLFEKFNPKKCKRIFPNNDLDLIDSIIHDLEMIKKGKCSKDFEEKTNMFLIEKFDSESVKLIKNYYDF